MKTIIFCDTNKWLDFAPLTLTRPIGDLRVGLYTQTERWQKFNADIDFAFETENYLQQRFKSAESGIKFNACVIPSKALINAVLSLNADAKLVKGNLWIAGNPQADTSIEWTEDCLVLEQRWHIYQKNGQAIEQDFELITAGRTSAQMCASNTVIGDPQKVFLEPGAKVQASILNTTSGPIYIGQDAEIMEGSVVRGPLGMLENSALKLSSKVYGPTTLGPHCKVGGEVNNVIFQAYSNKGHDGFLGNSVVGEWCNLGADTNSSNLKNNYGKVKTYSYRSKSLEQTDVQFMGLIMGDHSKSSINSMFNTASVVGVSTNIFGNGFPDKYSPSFQWGQGQERYNFEKAIESANAMMVRRGLSVTSEEKAILEHIFKHF